MLQTIIRASNEQVTLKPLSRRPEQRRFCSGGTKVGADAHTADMKLTNYQFVTRLSRFMCRALERSFDSKRSTVRSHDSPEERGIGVGRSPVTFNAS